MFKEIYLYFFFFLFSPLHKTHTAIFISFFYSFPSVLLSRAKVLSIKNAIELKAVAVYGRLGMVPRPTLLKLRATKSGDTQTLSCSKTQIDGSQGSKIVKGSVGFLLRRSKVRGYGRLQTK